LLTVTSITAVKCILPLLFESPSYMHVSVHIYIMCVRRYLYVPS